VSSPNRRHLHTREILERLEAGESVSQRSLSRDLGIALGLTNLLLRQMARKGWVRLRRLKANRVRYLITPSGVAEKARLSRDHLRETIRFYAEARNRLRTIFAPLAMEAGATAVPLRVVFWGAGEVAEVAFICLQDSSLVLVAVIDDNRVGNRFFGYEVRPSQSVEGLHVAGEPFDRIIVFPGADAASVHQRLGEVGRGADRVLAL
jgi:DNA-binding MarR family transcriptional regulator